MNGLLLFLFGLVADTFSMLLGGYILTKLWAWFVVSQFGVYKLSLVPAIGICVIVSFLTHQYIDQKENIDLWKLALNTFLQTNAYNLTMFALGYIVYLCL